MKAVVDTNVLISGIFFGGLPRRVLEAWADGRFELLLSPLIFDEYLRTCDRLGGAHPGLEYRELLAAFLGHGTLVADASGSPPITADPDDDKFMLCAHAAGGVVVSGDTHLHDVSGWHRVEVLTPRSFLNRLPPSTPKAI